MRAIFEIRDAGHDDRDAVRELHRRSSLVWDADRASLEAHPELFGVSIEAIDEGRARVALAPDGTLVGFSVIAHVEPGVCELDDLFVDPEVMTQGIGSALVADVATRALAAGDRVIVVTANPDAIGFYERVGFARGASVPTQFRPGMRMRRALASPAASID
jgi:GNAT superfamily N-acetyltransferase